MLDRTDRDILAQLMNNVRLSNKELAAAVGLAPSSCLERVRRLRGLGILKGAHAVVEPRAFGVGLEALLMIELAKHSRDVVDRFLAEVSAMAEVRSAFLITGRYDFVVHVAVRDMAHLKDLSLDRFTSRPEVTRIETSIIFDYAMSGRLPDLTASGDDDRP